MTLNFSSPRRLSAVLSLAGTLLLSSQQSAFADRNDGMRNVSMHHGWAADGNGRGRGQDNSANVIREHNNRNGNRQVRFDAVQRNNDVNVFQRGNLKPFHPGNRRFDIKSFQENPAGKTVPLASGVDLNLGSEERNIVLGGKLFSNISSVTIQVGGETKNVSAGSEVTAAEYVAVKQVLSSGQQSLTLDQSGRASGGELDLSSITAKNDRMRADDLLLPANVTTLGDFGKRSTFQIQGDLVNAGSLYAVSSRSNVKGGIIQADNITNQQGGLITSDVDLVLSASGTVTNNGTITSSGNLVVSGGSIRNAGRIESTQNDVVLRTAVPETLTVDNTGGVIAAHNGAIYIREPGFNAAFDTDVYGGDLFSQQLNVSTGQGVADVSVNQLTGTINETGLASHISANTETLSLGNICLAGDPTYKNGSGDIVFNGNLRVGEDLTVISVGNITNSVAANIEAFQGQDGFNITLIAGANLTPGGPDTPNLSDPDPPTDTSASFTGASAGGGSVILGLNAPGASPVLISNSRRDGSKDILIAAFAGGNPGSGHVDLFGSTIDASGNGNNSVDGTVTIIAGGSNTGFAAIVTGTIFTSGAELGGGSVTISGRQPTSNATSYNADGTLSSGGIAAGPTVPAGAGVFVSGNITADNSISITTGDNASLSIGPGVTLATTQSNGSVTLDGSASSDVNAGAGSLISTNTLTLNLGAAAAGTLLAPINTNAPNLNAFGNTAASTVFINDTNNSLVALDILINDATITTAGTMISSPVGQVVADTLFLHSLNGSIGLNAANPLMVDAANSNVEGTFLADQNVFVENVDTALMVLNTSNAAKQLNIKSAGAIGTSGGVVTLSAQNVVIDGADFNSLAGNIIGTTSVSLLADSDITNAKIPALINTAQLNLRARAGDVGVSAGTRFNVGTLVKAVTATADAGDVFLAAPATKRFAVAGGFANGTFDFLGAGSSIISKDITTTNGDLNLAVAVGSLSTNTGVSLTAGQNMLLAVTDTSSTASKSKLSIGKKGGNLQSLNGNITLSVGAMGASVVGTPPSRNVSFAELGGQIFWGQFGLSAKSPTNFVIAKNADVIINNPLAANNISLGGGVVIVADPPITTSP